MVVLRTAIPRVTELFPQLTRRQLEWATVAVHVAFRGSSAYLMLGPVRSAIHARSLAQSANA